MDCGYSKSDVVYVIPVIYFNVLPVFRVYFAVLVQPHELLTPFFRCNDLIPNASSSL